MARNIAVLLLVVACVVAQLASAVPPAAAAARALAGDPATIGGDLTTTTGVAGNNLSNKIKSRQFVKKKSIRGGEAGGDFEYECDDDSVLESFHVDKRP